MKYMWITIVSIFIMNSNFAWSWGQTGHRVTAEIAQRNIAPVTQVAIQTIIGGQSLAELSTWGDQIRSDPSWDFAESWHFISVEDDDQWDALQRQPAEIGDILRSLEEIEAMLADPAKQRFVLSGSAEARDGNRTAQQKEVSKRELLAFYLHFMGDLHQPLHVGRKDDWGANKIGVEWFGEERNLHRVWDEDLIDSLKLSYTELANFLNRVESKTQADWSAGDYLDWAKESKSLREQVYDFGKQRTPYFLNVNKAPKLSWEYRYKSLPIVRERLAQGGIRLAAKLDHIFAISADPTAGASD